MNFTKEKNRRKKFIDSLRFVGIFVSLISVLLIFFGLSAAVSDISGRDSESITGNLVLIEGEGKEINISLESEEIFEELNDDLICFLESGIQEQDVVVLGNLLRDMDCPSGNKKNVSAVIEGNCVLVNVEEEGFVKLCSEGLLLDINLNLVNIPDVSEGFFPQEVTIPTKNYYWYILFFMILIIIILFWREYEIELKTDIELRAEKRYMERRKKKEELLKKSIEEEKVRKSKNKEIFHVPTAPLYDKKKARKREKEKKTIKIKLKKSDEMKKKETDNKKNKLILEFNKKSEKINDHIISAKLLEARKEYILLFEVYSQLITLVNKKNQKRLDEIMQYLCNYLGILEKAKYVKRKGMRQQIGEEQAIKPKSKVISMDKLDMLKELINKKHYTQAKNLFYGGKIEKFDIKDAVKNATTKKEKDEINEIELRHDKLIKKGAVNIDEDDFYKFMFSMTELRKEIKKQGNKNYKKKS